ncbi:unnamed protein product [Withania somnifera]
MVNLVEAQKPLLHGLMKLAGIKPHSIEIEPGTIMNFWVPSETLVPKTKKSKNNNNNTTPFSYNQCSISPESTTKPNPNKLVVVLIHGFAGEGIVTWQFQVGALTKKYSVYVPDLLFSAAECLSKGLRKLGVENCVVVGFSYGGMVAFKMAEMYPDLVEALVVSGSILAMTDSISTTTLNGLGFSSSSELLLPTTVKGLKALLKVAAYKKLWFPDCFHRDFLQVMFTNRKERGELLEGLVVSNKETTIPNFPQRIHLLWGKNDQIFNLELAQNMKLQLGDKTTFRGIDKAGHLVHLERPCVYNKCLKQFLTSLHAEKTQK